ncbi:HAD hydrolase-like protein [Streptomyces griseoruber]
MPSLRPRRNPDGLRPGIAAGVASALTGIGVPVPDGDTLRSFVGPPMYRSFREVVGLDELTAKRALRLYRAAYAETGDLDSRMYDGVPGLLEELAAAGIPMAVATSKVEDQAVRITEHYGLATHLVTVCGTSDRAGRTTKRDVIRECLRRRTGHCDRRLPPCPGTTAAVLGDIATTPCGTSRFLTCRALSYRPLAVSPLPGAFITKETVRHGRHRREDHR